MWYVITLLVKHKLFVEIISRFYAQSHKYGEIKVYIMTKKTFSNLKNSAVLTALLATTGAAHATNSQPDIYNNIGGPETEVVVSPTINASPTANAKAGANNNTHVHSNTNSAANAAGGEASATGGSVDANVNGSVNGTIADMSNTTNNVNAGGAEVENSMNGTIADNSQTSNIAGGAEVENTMNANLSNGGVTDNSQSYNNAGGAEVENSVHNDLSNGGVNGTIADNSTTHNNAGGAEVSTDVDASSQNDLAQTNEQTNAQDQTNNQSTDVDTSNSGNSENSNSQNTEVGGNNSSYTNNSTYKSGAAANIPQAAAIFATKSCVSSTSVGLGGGNVYAGYGGLSFSHVGSEAVSLVGEMTVNGEVVDVAYTIPELADLSPVDRAPIFTELRKSEQEKATCLMGNYIAQERALTKAYKQATGVAQINAEAHTSGIAINAQANMYIEEVRAKGAIDHAKTEAIGAAFNQTVKHACNLGATVINTGNGKQDVVAGTVAIRGQGHENCEDVMWGTFNQLTDGKAETTKPDFSQFTKSVKAAPRLQQ
tara:strand:+ start:66697 stop:68319 length:1623 start_codon:yes stop_codon:yes gene_type:complete